MRCWRLRRALLACAAAVLLWPIPAPARDAVVEEIRQAQILESDATAPPPATAAWQPAALPLSRGALPNQAPRVTWLRMRFDVARQPAEFWGVLLLYMYGGGQVWLDGRLVGELPVASAAMHVRWERPCLIVLPRAYLGAGRHELAIRASPVDGETVLQLPAPRVGPLADLRVQHDRRHFWMHTMPELTAAGCLVVTMLMLLIWWRLPEEVLYGWFGIAALMWGIRTLTFVIEAVPPERWQWWRLLYLASTGGFIVVLALFAGRLGGMHSRWTERALLAYWAVGPAWRLASGMNSDEPVNRLWTAGLIPIAIGIVVVSIVTARRQRTPGSLLLPGALALATLTGIHDYLLVWKPALLARLVPRWAGERYFLLHYGADLVLVAMGVLLCARFVISVRALRVLNETLESRIADRERALNANFSRMAELERENAAAMERKLIMREIHDGLGSKLFTSLSRVERGAMDATEMASSLRACIADMRLALEALAPDDHDLRVAFGDFMFRWGGELQAAAVRCSWSVELPDDSVQLGPHATLQLLRMAQEALTNVAKHAKARMVDLSLVVRDGRLVLRIADDGVGLPPDREASGRGLRNMLGRAQQLGGTVTIARGPEHGTIVTLTLELASKPGIP
ncbi:Signal transduction histidine kinase [Duganella sp. CF517]|uniref:sensor histidine kinase n=1 Tax=Duganella sp. CF517 TaxID=1881038 RepID=UPI0008BC28A6|nr:ATP-binding protein [Duganella sp. CF517]SEN82565.1 Signal transduction histidine kinase [Duganella sp. CF517]